MNLMMDKSQVEKNIQWLLSNGSSPVRYLTYKHLMKNDHNSETMKIMWSEVEKCSMVQEIFSKQKQDGSWCSGGSWAPNSSYVPKGGYSAFTPKYVTTVWILSMLGDMDFDIRDDRVKKACDYTLAFQRPNGRFSRFFKDQAIQLKREEGQDINRSNFPCELGVYLLGLGKVGMGSDVRLKKSYDLLAKWQREDGGWVNDKHRVERKWSRSCPAVSHNAAAALYFSRLPEYKDNVCKALKFLIWHLSIIERSELQRFYYHGHNMVQELLMLSELGIGLYEDSIQTVLKWLMSMYYIDEGYFRYKEKSVSKDYEKRAKTMTPELRYRSYHLTEDDWFTYYMTRIGVNIIQIH